MRLLTYVVPALLVGFFIWRGRRDPVYILALPLLLACGRGIFLDLYSLKVPLGGGVTVGQEDILMLALSGVFVYILALRPDAEPTRLTGQLYLCLGILILLTTKAFAAYSSRWGDLASPGQLLSVVKAALVARAYFYLPTSIVLWHLVLKRFSEREVLHLLRILTWVTAACSIVYLVNLAGFRTYTAIWPAYSAVQVSGAGSVIRDYLTMPFWLYLGLAYSLARLVYGGQRFTYLLAAIVMTGCAVFSFTRSYAVCALGLWVVAGFWKVVVVPLHWKTIGPRTQVGPAHAWIVITAPAALSVAVVAGWGLLGDWWAYLGTRFGSLSQGPAGDLNVLVRFRLYAQASQAISHAGFFLGWLMIPSAAATGVYFLDSYWASVLFELGWIGLLVLGALALGALGKATAMAVKAEGESAVLRLAVFSGLSASVLLSLTGAWLAFAVVGGAFLLSLPDVRLRVTPNVLASFGRAVVERR